MTLRTRSELIDFLCLIFAIGPSVAGPFPTLEAYVAASGIDPTAVARIGRSGLMRSIGVGDPGAAFGRDAARTTAVAARLLELGAGDDDLAVLADALDGHCASCPAGSPCPRRCDTLDELHAVLSRLLGEARDTTAGIARRAPALGRAIRSIEQLGDLI